MRCKHLDLKLEEKKTYWWCSEFNKYVDYKGCTILPCKPDISLAGCESAELSDKIKTQLRESMLGGQT